MPSRRLCVKCRAVTAPGESYCDAHRNRRGGQLGWDWQVIRRDHLHDHPRCVGCGGKATTVDHIVARAFGGTHDPSNLRSLCGRCAHRKDVADAKEGMRRARGRRGTPRGDRGSS